MTIRYSTALRNFLQQKGSFKHAFANGVLLLYSGTQPASADAAPGGNLLCTISLASGAVTNEVQSQGKVALTGGSSGSVDTLTVNSLEIMGSSTPFNTSLAQTAQDIADKCNNNPKNWLFDVSASGANVIITAKPGLGTLPNGWAVASTVTTITKTDTNMGSLTAGVNAVNGLKFGLSTAGALVKDASQTWSGVGTAAAGTGVAAGFFRLCGSVADAQAQDSAATYLRVDGSIATSGADLNVSSTTIVQGATFSVDTFTFTEPGTA